MIPLRPIALGLPIACALSLAAGAATPERPLRAADRPDILTALAGVDADGDQIITEADLASASAAEAAHDRNGDGVIDGADLGDLLGAWGAPGADGAALGALLGAWGAAAKAERWLGWAWALGADGVAWIVPASLAPAWRDSPAAGVRRLGWGWRFETFDIVRRIEDESGATVAIVIEPLTIERAAGAIDPLTTAAEPR